VLKAISRGSRSCSQEGRVDRGRRCQAASVVCAIRWQVGAGGPTAPAQQSGLSKQVCMAPFPCVFLCLTGLLDGDCLRGNDLPLFEKLHHLCPVSTKLLPVLNQFRLQTCLPRGPCLIRLNIGLLRPLWSFCRDWRPRLWSSCKFNSPPTCLAQLYLCRPPRGATFVLLHL
jgi:hypothetical protein